jgi:predicted TIM-barrel fold metal-dependent hydrolase
MKPYYTLSERDTEFYREHLGPRLPSRMYDIHVHVNLQEHVDMVPEQRWLSDWAMEIGHVLPVDDALACAAELFPDSKYAINGFPMPVKEGDLHASNRYLAQESRRQKLTAFMCIMPGWDDLELERGLSEEGFLGVKPYPDMVSGVKGADIGIFDFMPPRQWEIVNSFKKTVMLHLPGKDRLPADQNIEELKRIRQDYPDLGIIIAHFGRSFCPVYLDTGLKKLGSAEGFYFDTSAVLNPEVYDIAFSRLDPEQILFGTDMPITLFHGKREWTDRAYINLSSEDYSWNTERRPPEDEAQYTLFIYEELRAILDAMDRNGLSPAMKECIFFRNAERILNVG